MIQELTENNGTKYSIPHGLGEYILPRTEFLLHKVKSIEQKLLQWYFENKCDNGDGYSVSITKNGKWMVSHSNDYPMQHGSGSSHVFSEQDFINATNIIYEPPLPRSSHR